MDGLAVNVKEFPEAVAVIQLTVGVPTVIVGLVVDPGLSLPTTETVWAAETDPLEEEKVLKAGLPNSTGTVDAVTRRETGTVAKATPLAERMIVAV